MNAAPLWKPSSKVFIQNPYPVYEQLRTHGSVFKAETGDYVLIGYEGCKQVLQDPSCLTGLRKDWVVKMNKYSKEHGEDFDGLEEAISGMLIQLNAPIHPVLREALAKAWPGKNEIKSLANEICGELIENVPSSFDGMERLCKKLPLYMICALLGLDRERATQHMNDGLRLVQLLDPYLTYRDLKVIQESSTRLNRFINESISSPDYNPTSLAQSILDNKSNVDPVAMMTFLFIAGFETTSTLLATCLHQLLIHPIYRDGIEEHGAQKFVRELLRLYSPVQVTGRITTFPIQVDGVKIPEGTALTLCVGAANLDPHHFPEPEILKWDRPNHHLSFGYGIHHCLGSQLAELEAEALVQYLMPLLPSLELTEEPKLENKLTIRSYQSLPLRVL